MNNNTLLEEAPSNQQKHGGNIPDVESVIDLPDLAVESEPTEIDLQLAEEYDRLESQYGRAFVENFIARASPYDVVKWPMVDANSPDYANTVEFATLDEFILDGDVLDRLIAVNRFSPYQDKGVLAFALRGATLSSDFDAEKVDRVKVLNTRPDHINFRCLIGFYFLEDRKITVYTGSTVPCRKAVFYYGNGGENCNLLPNGLYTYYIWRHKSLKPALRLSKSNANRSALEEGQLATVLRTKNDKIFGIRDEWNVSVALDNVHCSRFISYNENFGSYFSSWGCLTVRGKAAPTDQWKKFQAVLDDIGSTSRVDLMLLTGKDAALAALSIGVTAVIDVNHLVRLRVGSQGSQVTSLQRRLGASDSGYFGYETRKKLTELQRELSSRSGGEASADGIYAPALDAKTGWGIFPGTASTLSIFISGGNTGASSEDNSLRPMPASDFPDKEPLPKASDTQLPQTDIALLQPILFSIDPSAEPQTTNISFYATENFSGDRFYVAKSAKYRTRIGLARSSTLLQYDREAAEQHIGLWAHFMWPTVMGESSGHHLTINSYDRAHFTWGFYQLAAHTPKDNLILLMRELLTLPSAAAYFPDLKLINGRVHQTTDAGNIDLEHERAVVVGRRTEVQIPRFMTYMNPSSTRIDNQEILNAAKLIHWATNDPEVIKMTIKVSLGILKRKALIYANKYGLFGRRPELAIWVCDMFHQGRGASPQVRAALALSTFAEQLEALSRIDSTGQYEHRLQTVKRYVKVLLDEERFKDVKFGEGKLEL